MEKPSKKIRILILILLAIVVLYLLLDIHNILGLIGISSSTLNIELLSVLIDILIAVGIFAATYILLDSRSVRKEKNAIDAINVILQLSYKNCRAHVQMLQDQEIRNKLAERVDFNAYGESEVSKSLKKSPFEYHDLLLSYIDQGFLSGEMLKQYLAIHGKYCTYITNLIIFFDQPAFLLPLERELLELLDKAIV